MIEDGKFDKAREERYAGWKAPAAKGDAEARREP